MSVFSKIFGSASKKIVGDEGRILVPVYLDSIAVGANPKTQVEKIRAIVGDSVPEFNGFLDELAMAGDEKPEVIAKAVAIVKDYYNEHMAGDEKDVTTKKEGDNKSAGEDDKKAGDNKSAGEDDKKAGDNKSAGEGDNKSAGDGDGGAKGMKLSGDEIEAIAQKTAAIMLASQAKAEPKTAGDESALPDNSTLMAGDSGSKNAKSSDDITKEIWG